MCNIEYTTFNVNGEFVQDCVAKTTDVITIDLGARFVSAEIGSWTAWIAVSYNNGAEEYHSATRNVLQGINDFIVSIPSKAGVIKVTQVSINNAAGTIQCGPPIENPPMLDCNTLTVTAAGSIKFISNPSGAEIILNNSDQHQVTPHTITGIPVGTNSYRLILLNHPDITGNVIVLENKIAQVSVDFTTGQVNVGAILLGLGVTAVLIGGLYYMTRKPETSTSITTR